MDDVDDNQVIGEDGVCHELFENSRNCNENCQTLGAAQTNNSWSGAEVFYFVLLILAGAGMMFVIIGERKKVSDTPLI